ncbi:MAG: toxic anion resistance protein [Clostridia bacterium]|nr:toxic anion resistance protein [Clostridia bacterium]
MKEQETNAPVELTLDPFATPAPVPAAAAPAAENASLTEAEARLTPAEQEAVRNFAEKLDVTDTNMVLQYGAGAQQKMATFSEAALQNVRTKDLGEVGDMISNLVGELKGFSVDEEEEKRGLFGLFKKAGNRIAMLQANYAKAETNVDKITGSLEGHQVQLFKDIAMLDEMYQKNQTNFKELSMYLLAGNRKLAQVRATELPALIEKAQKSGLPEDAQAANDLAAMCNRFEKKLHDLELTRVISVQMAPQIRMVQNNDSLMAEKIQTTLTNTIPLWKSQMVLALGLAHSQQAMQAQREVTDMTNELLRKNAEKLKMTTIETAKESERGIVDIETLTYTNQQLISTLDEVLTIQAEGAQKRREAQAELGRIEGELKQKLLEIKR